LAVGFYWSNVLKRLPTNPVFTLYICLYSILMPLASWEWAYVSAQLCRTPLRPTYFCTSMNCSQHSQNNTFCSTRINSSLLNAYIYLVSLVVYFHMEKITFSLSITWLVVGLFSSVVVLCIINCD
jgi:hypothetical protein